MRARVLNVEERDLERSFRTDILQRAGFDVVEADRYDVVPELAAAMQPAVVLLEVWGSGEGFEACRRLKANPETAGLAVIVVSPLVADPAGRIRALKEGAAWCLAEPVAPAEIVATIAAMLRRIGAGTDDPGPAVGAVLRHQAELERLYYHAPIGLCVLDENLRYERINQCLARLNGRAVEAHLGKPVHDMIPLMADAVDPVLLGLFDTATGCADWELSGQADTEPDVTRTGIVNGWMGRDSATGAPRLSIAVLEITERHRIEQATRESEQRLRLVLAGTRAAVFEWDVTHGAISWTDEGRVMWAGAPPPTTYDRWLDQVCPEDRLQADQQMRELVHGGTDRTRVECGVDGPDGTRHQVQLIPYAMERKGREAVRVAGIGIDVTDVNGSK